jgi:hypothetical protein
MVSRCQKSVLTCFRIAVLLFCTCTGAWAQMVGTLTMAEGKVTLIRGTTVYAVAEGTKLQDGDILQTDAKGQAQVEFQGGPTINFAAGTQALLLNLSKARGEAEFAVLVGWVKFMQKKANGAIRFYTPVAQFAAEDATAVLHATAGAVEIFIESGTANFFESGKKGSAGGARTVRGGEFIVRTGDQPAVVGARPSAQFVGALPRHFKDNLPARIDRVKDRKVEPKRDHEASYAEVEAWLKASPPVRKSFVRRFQSRAHDAEFRKGLIANLREHPEWDPVLYPEKYRPKQEKKQEKRQ